MPHPPTHSLHAPTGFMVFHSNRMATLLEVLVNFFKQYPLAPLAPETILVQSNGMKHWLSKSLAAQNALGICAATRMVLPATQLWQIYRTVLGSDRLPMDMPLDKAPLVWRILRLLPKWLADPRYAVLAHYMGHEGQGIRAFHLAQQLADVLDGYQNYRSDWLNAWRKGRNTWGRGQSLPVEQVWQADMWRDLLEDVQQHAPWSHQFESRAEVHQAFLDTLQRHPPGQISGLPPRLMVFGVTALPMQTMQALVALGRHLPVLVFVHNPCPSHWGHVTEDLSQGGHPLLAAWGKQGRDYLHALDQFEATDEQAPSYVRVDTFVDPLKAWQDDGKVPGALQRLQADLFHLTPPPNQPVPLTQPDDSVVFVQAHSAQREVEVLHDRVLQWLNADPDLQPADIMVMVPDMNVFAPHIHAVFGRHGNHAPPGMHLSYAVNDTAPRTHPLVQAVDTLMQLPQLRLTLGDWLGLFQVKAVRDRYALSESDIVQLQEWLGEAGVRWGLDANQRQRWGMDINLPDADQNTWRFGLRRLLLGYALGPSADSQIWQHVAAHAAIDGLDARQVGGLLQWLDDMDDTWQALQTERGPAEWLGLWQTLIHRFFLVTDEADQRVFDQLLAPLEEALKDCQLAAFEAPLSLGVVRSHWMKQLDAVGPQPHFALGGVQFATLMPMRAIPFKVVCLLGMNDSAYPRNPTPRDFDLIAQPGQARPGDRARRDDDRYLFLEAVLSASERLYLSWQGRRTNDHAPLPPSVVVAQLLDHLNRCHSLVENGTEAPAFVATLQPLQPYASAYFTQGSGFTTYAAEWATVHGSDKTQSLSTAASASSPPDTLNDQALRTLLRQPVAVFFKHHLQVTADTPQAEDEDSEPFDLTGLKGYRLKQALLHASDPKAWLAQCKARGELALSGFGASQINDLLAFKTLIDTRLEPLRHDTDQAWPVTSWDMHAHGVTLQLTLGGALSEWRRRVDGSGLRVGLYAGKVMQGHALTDLWLDHLTANATGIATQSVQIGEDGAVTLQALSPTQARAWLEDLVRLYQQAWHAPLPVARKSALDFLNELHKPGNASLADTARQAKALGVARLAFDGNRFRAGELTRSPYLQRVFTRFDDMDASRFVALATQLYGPIWKTRLAHTAPNREASP